MSSSSAPILLVDDNAFSRRLLARSLEMSGFDVLECSSGREALELIEAGEPMLLVLDYEMPELTGVEVCAQVRANIQPAIATLPIILLTAHIGEKHEIECLSAGADDFVTKPVNATTLKARIQTQMRLHGLRTELREQKIETDRWRALHELDLDAARSTQQAILPAHLPGINGWQVAAHYQPLIQVGGDVYDWLRLPDGAWLIWIADATGHGAAAALLTTFMKLVFRHAATEGQSAGEILNTVNADVFAVFKGRSFLTAACLIVRPGSEEVIFAGAGHPALLIRRLDGHVESVSSKAPPVGVHAELRCGITSIKVEPGETLLLYTDGLYSMKDESGERLIPADAQNLIPPASKSAADFLDQVVTALNSGPQSESISDDVAVIALRRE
ncbi:MAG: response regulator receiver modulated serine phosphatase [Chthoniobacteraceae bacterium]|nr:response regulator receiver modulated serine phosphatase [Chthoniobacteraceae bacterium]